MRNSNRLNFAKNNGNLILTLTDEGREDLPDLLDKYGEDGESIILELAESHLCNGWANVEVCLWGGLIALTDEATYDDDGNITKCGSVYVDKKYAIRNPIGDLVGKGFLILQGFE